MMAVETKKLVVIGDNKMHCGGCESTVTFALNQLSGIQKVEADHRSQRIRVSYDPALVDLEKVREELDWIGYEVEEEG